MTMPALLFWSHFKVLCKVFNAMARHCQASCPLWGQILFSVVSGVEVPLEAKFCPNLNGASKSFIITLPFSLFLQGSHLKNSIFQHIIDAVSWN